MSHKGKASENKVLKGRISRCNEIIINAYHIAVKNGFEGTEEEWLKSLEVNPDTIVDAVNAYLEENPVSVDTTLSKSGAAADAKTTGDRFASMDEEISAVRETVEAIPGENPEITAHLENKNNPHATTAEQIGLGNVDNTSDADKPVSTAQATAIADAKQAGTNAMTAAENAAQKATEAINKANAISLESIGAARSDHDHVMSDITDLNISYKIYKSLAEIGLSGKVTMNQVCSALPQYSCLMTSNSTSSANTISDAPCSYGFIEIVKNGIYGHARATRGGSSSYEYYLGAYYGASDGAYQGFSGWTRMMPNVLGTYEHGTTLPTSGFTKGRVFFKKVSG